MNTYPQVLAASSMLGNKVVSPEGEELGILKELMIDLDEGQINYAVLSFGGFLGLGNKLFAIPWEALTLNTDDHTFILDVDKEQLKNAPGFDKDNWPNDIQYESGWLIDLYEYYGYAPYWVTESELEQREQQTDS